MEFFKVKFHQITMLKNSGFQIPADELEFEYDAAIPEYGPKNLTGFVNFERWIERRSRESPGNLIFGPDHQRYWGSTENLLSRRYDRPSDGAVAVAIYVTFRTTDKGGEIANTKEVISRLRILREEVTDFGRDLNRRFRTMIILKKSVTKGVTSDLNIDRQPDYGLQIFLHRQLYYDAIRHVLNPPDWKLLSPSEVDRLGLDTEFMQGMDYRDPMAIYLGAIPGDVVRIGRSSWGTINTITSLYYEYRLIQAVSSLA